MTQPLALNANEKKITRDAFRALNLTRDGIVTATALLSEISTKAFWGSLRDYAMRQCAALGIAQTGAAGSPPGTRRAAGTGSATRTRKAKAAGAGRAV